jgi:hypothetical protein
MPSYVLPQVLVFQEFAAQPAQLAQPQSACIVGPQYSLHRYTEERSEIHAGSYDPVAEECFAWPNRPAGGVVDSAFTRVYLENAHLQYFNDPAGDASVITHVSPGKNRIRAESKIFQTANGYSRSPDFLRDVQIGDVAKVLASSCGEPVSLTANVVALIADVLAAIVDSAEVDIDNQAATSAATSSSQTAGSINNVGIDSVDGASYDGLPDGDPSETYTVEVVAGSTGGDATSALLRVTSASGLDDVAEVTPAAFASPTTIGTRGLTVTFVNNTGSSSSGSSPVDPDDFLIGQKWEVEVSQAFTPAVPTSGGTYTGTADTSYIAEVTRGGLFSSSTKPQITVTTTTGIDISGPTTVSASGAAVVAGSRGVTISFAGAGLCKGDRYIVAVEASKAGPVRTLALDRNLPDALRGVCGEGTSSSSSGTPPDLDLTLYVKKNIEVTEDRLGAPPLVNWTQNATQLCMQAGVTAFDADFQSSGVLVPLPVKTGDIYIHYRALISTNCSTVGTLSDVSQVASVLGPVSPDNPLAFGVYNALLNNNGEDVHYLGVCDTSGNVSELLEPWLDALEILVGRDDVYSLVPLTQYKPVLDAFLAHCLAQSTPENSRWRICWLNMAAAETLGVYTTSVGGGTVLATIKDDPDTAGLQYTVVEADGEQFITSGVRAGDTVRALYTSDGFGNFTYSEFVVDAVLNEETIRLVTGPAAAVNTPSKLEIWRTLTKNELATSVATNPGLFGSRRAYLVWPDVVGNAGITFEGFYLCAALAGLRSGVLPHQGLTNVAINGFDDLSRTVDFFSANQLNTLAASGYWIVTQDPSDGTVFTRHQLSTGDQDDINQREQSITTNLDNISANFLLRMKQFIGRGNVTPTMITILLGEFISLIEQFKNTIINDKLGPQILNATITELAPSTTLRDRIVARVNVELPAPFNNLELHLIA